MTITNGNGQCEKSESIGPAWMDADYFKDILALEGKSKWKYISHEIKMANEKGDNYASVLFRAKVVAENEDNVPEELSYILKTNHVLLEGPTKDMMEVFDVFGKEVETYKTIVPAFQKLLQEAGDFTQISPKCIKTSTPTIQQIVLEDLSKKGFRMASRHAGLDMDHTKLVINRLTKFHAASAVYHELNGEYSEALRQGMFNEKMKPVMDTYFTTNLSMLRDGVGKLKEGERYLKRLENYEAKSFDKSMEAIKSDPNGFNVLNHGDLWTNNIMFKYDDDNKLQDMLFIDLQLPVWGSPAIDLYYFIVSSTEKKLKVKEFDTIIQYYHENLVKMLKKLGYKKHIPTLLELQLDLLKRGFLGVMDTMMILPVVMLKDCEDADINNMLDDGDAGMNFKRKLYNNPEFIDMLDMLYEYYDKKGLLEI